MTESVVVASEDQAWSEIEEFVASISQLSQTLGSTDSFLEQVLEQTIGFLGAAAGAAWLQDQPGQFSLRSDVNIELLASSGAQEIADAHEQFLHAVIRSGEPQVLPPGQATAPLQSIANSSGYCWIASPFRIDGQVAGVLEVLQSPQISPAAQAGHAKLIRMVCELIGDFLRLVQVQDLRNSEVHWQHYERLVQRVQASRSLQEVAYQIVNEGRNLIRCDRLSLLVVRREQLELLATSGVDTPDPRASSVRAMVKLAEAVRRIGRTIQYRAELEQFPPQITDPLSEYIDAARVFHVDVIPLQIAEDNDSVSQHAAVGILVVDQFNATGDDLHLEGLRQVRQLAALSLDSALQHDAWPVRMAAKLSQALSALRQRRSQVLVGAMCLILLAAVLLIPVNHEVRVEGELRPEIQREIYAPLDGEVVSIKRQHDEDVAQGEVLLVLRSRQLELELQRVQGEYQTTEKRLMAVRSARVQTPQASPSANSLPGQLAAEEQELNQRLASLQEQLELLRQQREQLTIRSPIAGRVLTWDAIELLEDRPVQRGHLLMSTADINGSWLLELSVPEHRVGAILNAMQAEPQALPVTFTLATDRNQRFSGKIKSVAARTEPSETQPEVPVIASVDEGDVKLLRPGATVLAKVDCGRRSLGFVWFHDIFEKVKGWIFL